MVMNPSKQIKKGLLPKKKPSGVTLLQNGLVPNIFDKSGFALIFIKKNAYIAIYRSLC